jgi:hypothetical protein
MDEDDKFQYNPGGYARVRGMSTDGWRKAPTIKGRREKCPKDWMGARMAREKSPLPRAVGHEPLVISGHHCVLVTL